jgi:hypothetical protein
LKLGGDDLHGQAALQHLGLHELQCPLLVFRLGRQQAQLRRRGLVVEALRVDQARRTTRRQLALACQRKQLILVREEAAGHKVSTRRF